MTAEKFSETEEGKSISNKLYAEITKEHDLWENRVILVTKSLDKGLNKGFSTGQKAVRNCFKCEQSKDAAFCADCMNAYAMQARQEALEEAIETARITIHGKQENPCYCWGCDQSATCEWEKLNEALQALKSKPKGGFAVISKCCGSATWHKPEDCPNKSKERGERNEDQP